MHGKSNFLRLYWQNRRSVAEKNYKRETWLVEPVNEPTGILAEMRLKWAKRSLVSYPQYTVIITCDSNFLHWVEEKTGRSFGFTNFYNIWKLVLNVSDGLLNSGMLVCWPNDFFHWNFYDRFRRGQPSATSSF